MFLFEFKFYCRTLFSARKCFVYVLCYAAFIAYATCYKTYPHYLSRFWEWERGERERKLVRSCFSFNLFVISLSEQMSQFLWNTLKLRGTHDTRIRFWVYSFCMLCCSLNIELYKDRKSHSTFGHLFVWNSENCSPILCFVFYYFDRARHFDFFFLKSLKRPLIIHRLYFLNIRI